MSVSATVFKMAAKHGDFHKLAAAPTYFNWLINSKFMRMSLLEDEMQTNHYIYLSIYIYTHTQYIILFFN